MLQHACGVNFVVYKNGFISLSLDYLSGQLVLAVSVKHIQTKKRNPLVRDIYIDKKETYQVSFWEPDIQSTFPP